MILAKVQRSQRTDGDYNQDLLAILAPLVRENFGLEQFDS